MQSYNKGYENIHPWQLQERNLGSECLTSSTVEKIREGTVLMLINRICNVVGFAITGLPLKKTPSHPRTSEYGPASARSTPFLEVARDMYAL